MVVNKQGERIAVVDNNPAGNPVLLVLHALTGKKENRTIDFVAKGLACEGCRAVQFDFSGHGESEGRIQDCTVTKQLADATVVADGLSLEGFFIIGNSFSCVTALALAQQMGARIKGVVLLSARARHMGYVETLRKTHDGYVLVDNIAVGEEFIADYSRHAPLDALSSLHCPVLVIHGGNDEVISVQEAYQFGNAGAEVVIIPDADHRFTNARDRVFSKVLEFVRKNS